MNELILCRACDIIGFMSKRIERNGGPKQEHKISDAMRAKGNVSKIIVDAFRSNKLPGNKREIKDAGDIKVRSWTSVFGGMSSSEKLPELSEWEVGVLPEVIAQVHKDIAEEKKEGKVIFENSDSGKDAGKRKDLRMDGKVKKREKRIRKE